MEGLLDQPRRGRHRFERTIGDIGVNEGCNYYFSVFEGVNTKCQYGVIFSATKHR